ncbi:hypothetical protein P4I85_14465 [Bacillus cereus]|uniref:hypothetical protein n=1 Tax=Bacillus thuringiensis TaxID=1428 RepID=UPI001298A101|nr:hypothetical protein [Bacillus thuringiensis]MEB9509598.1 hypothetical protein [Bacillus cereus]MEB9561690.1 hypothetical protein [Bacillus cereus]MRC03008.1 hypothetical protein [Bacillus thuringiensis]
MSYFLGYVDVNNDMYVMSGTTSASGHSFPMNQWTKAASNVKAAVISNEDYDSPCDGYIDMDNNLYIWNSNTTAILFDTNVKQADSSENRMLAYVKNDNTLWMANSSNPSYKNKVADNVDYVVSANNQLVYKTLDGRGFFSVSTSFTSSPYASFIDKGPVRDVAAAGANGGSKRYMYIDVNGTLYGTSEGTSPNAAFYKIMDNVKSVKKAGKGSIFLTISNDLYYEPVVGGTLQLIASNVADYWENMILAASLTGLFYTTLDNPTVLKVAKGNAGGPNSTPTPIKSIGSLYGISADTRIEVSTSDDGITFSPYTFFNPNSLPQKRFLKFRAILDGGTQTGEMKAFEFDQLSPEAKLVLNEFISSVDANVQMKTVYKIDGVKDDNYTDIVLFEIPVDRTKYKSISKIEVV